MSNTVKMLRKIHEANERESLVKDLISLRPISSMETRSSHPLITIYDDTNVPPAAIDQFTPYLTRKLAIKRKEKISSLQSKSHTHPPTFLLTNSNTKEEDKSLHMSKQHASIIKPNPPIPRLLDDNCTAKSCNITSRHLQLHLKMEECFDQIVSNSASQPLARLFESTLSTHFLADKVLFYHDVASVRVLYCPSTMAYCPHGSGLVGYSQFSRKTVIQSRAKDHIAYDFKSELQSCTPDSRVLVFPLFDSTSHVKCVIQIVRDPKAPQFTNEDEQFVQYLQSKCKIYSRWLFQPIFDDAFASDLMTTCRLRQFIESTREKLTKLFGCRDAEIWSLNKETDTIFQYSPGADAPINIPLSEAGIPGYALKKEIPVSCISARVHSAYNPKTDGNGDYSALVIPVRDPDTPLIYALVLRGKRIPQFFTDSDEKMLVRVAPYCISSLTSAETIEKNHQALEESHRQQKRLLSLLQVAETLAGQLRMDVLIPNIMKQACELVKSDRCSLFIVNETRDKLVTTFTGGLKNAIEIPLNSGIVGWSATKGEILNIKDAYDDPRFNKATDLKTGYRTLTILCVPIYDNNREIRGVTEMINKLEGVFTEEDEKMIQIFNVFCGISLENARLYKASLDLTMQLRSIRDISNYISQTSTIKTLLEAIVKNTRTVIGAVYAMFFLTENGQVTKHPFVNDEDFEMTSKKARQVNEEKSKEDNLGVKRAIIARLMQGSESEYDAEAKKEEELRNKRIQHVFDTKEGVLDNEEDVEKSTMIVPVLSSDKQVMGVIYMRWKKTGKNFTNEDKELLESYTVFLSLSLERFKLKNIAQLGSMEIEMQNSMTNEERTGFSTPSKLRMPDEERGALIVRNFEVGEWKGLDLFKALFNIFQVFDIQRKVKINAQTLFSFFWEVKESYNQVYYHNWTHAVDVTQFMAQLLVVGGMREIFNIKEILVLLVASICHDANHDGFSNSYNLKAQTPLGILFKNQSVMETHHCSVSISILTRDECNLFSYFDDDDLSIIWRNFIELILATDMSKHFEILDECKALLESGRDWKTNRNDRLLVMKLLIKAADISNVARQFETADKWCTVLCEEFFKQGDLERAQGMEYSSPMNDREHLDRPKSQIGFYQSVCLPLFEMLRMFNKEYDVYLEQVKSNLDKWIERAEIREKEEEERRKLAEMERQREEEEKQREDLLLKEKEELENFADDNLK